MEFRADLHIHSYHSSDSDSHPKDIVRYALRRKLNVIAVTDHETIRGGLETLDCVRQIPELTLDVVVGAETHTPEGEIIGLFLRKEIRSRKAMDVIEEIRDQGGVSVLVHPCRNGYPEEIVLRAVDAIEVFNLYNSARENLLAQELAIRMGKPGITGSDAHNSSEVGIVYTCFTTDNEVRDVFDRDFLSLKIVPVTNPAEC